VALLAGMPRAADAVDLRIGLSASTFTKDDLVQSYGLLPGLDLRAALPLPLPVDLDLLLASSFERSRGDAAYEDATFDLDGEATLTRTLFLVGVQSENPLGRAFAMRGAFLLALGSVVEESPALEWQYSGEASESHGHYGVRIEAGPVWALSGGESELGLVAFAGRSIALSGDTSAEPARNLHFGLRLEYGHDLGGE